MGFKPKKKFVPPDPEVKARLEAEKAAKPKLKCEIVYRRDGSSQEYRATGYFLDEAAMSAHAESFLESLNRAGGGGWRMLSKKVLFDASKPFEEEN